MPLREHDLRDPRSETKNVVADATQVRPRPETVGAYPSSPPTPTPKLNPNTFDTETSSSPSRIRRLILRLIFFLVNPATAFVPIP
jgi:hypothetical protein